MGAAFSQNTAEINQNAINSSITNDQALNSLIVSNRCDQFSSINLNIGGVKCFPNLNPQPTLEIAGEINITNQGSQLCNFKSGQTTQYLSNVKNSLSNSTNAATSQINKILQQAGSLSLASGTNTSQIAQNLVNQMLTNAISQNIMTCGQVAEQNSATNFTLCANLDKEARIDLANKPTQTFMATCISTGMYSAYGDNSSTNTAISQISQVVDIKQQGLWTIILAAAVLFLVLCIGPVVPLFSPSLAKSNAIWVFAGIYGIIILAFSALIGYGLYLLFAPPPNNIIPVNIDSTNDRLCFSLTSDPMYSNLNIQIPNQTYANGSLLAAAIESAINGEIYSTGDLIKTFADSVATWITGDTTSCSGTSKIQTVRVVYNDSDRTFTFYTYGGNKNSCGSDIIFNSCPNSILPTIDASKNIKLGTNYSNGSGTSIAVTSPMPQPPKSSNAGRILKSVLIGAGIFIISALLIFFLVKVISSPKSTATAATTTASKIPSSPASVTPAPVTPAPVTPASVTPAGPKQ
jgi:hypothetical protein